MKIKLRVYILDSTVLYFLIVQFQFRKSYFTEIKTGRYGYYYSKTMDVCQCYSRDYKVHSKHGPRQALDRFKVVKQESKVICMSLNIWTTV